MVKKDVRMKMDSNDIDRIREIVRFFVDTYLVLKKDLQKRNVFVQEELLWTITSSISSEYILNKKKMMKFFRGTKHG